MSILDLVPAPTKLTIYAVGISAIFLTGFATGWHELKLRQPALIADQIANDKKECNDATEVMQKAQAGIQADHDAIADELSRLKQLHPSTCIVVPASGAANSVGTKGRRTGQNGTTTDAFREYAADYRVCQKELKRVSDFLDDERALIAKQH